FTSRFRVLSQYLLHNTLKIEALHGSSLRGMDCELPSVSQRNMREHLFNRANVICCLKAVLILRNILCDLDCIFADCAEFVLLLRHSFPPTNQEKIISVQQRKKVPDP